MARKGKSYVRLGGQIMDVDGPGGGGPENVTFFMDLVGVMSYA